MSFLGGKKKNRIEKKSTERNIKMAVFNFFIKTLYVEVFLLSNNY